MDHEEGLWWQYENHLVSDNIQRPHITMVYEVSIHYTYKTSQNVGRHQESPVKIIPEIEIWVIVYYEMERDQVVVEWICMGLWSDI